MKMTEELRPCPFCGGKAKLQLTDDEGNFKDESYLENPYSGVGYVIVHDTNNSTDCCPIATDSDSSQGIYIYASKEAAIITWNKRDCNDLKMPQINFIPLKQSITEDELNEYMVNSDDTNFLIYLRCKYKTDKEWEYLVEAATCGFDDGIIWLNDWDEGQQDVEYLAISKLGEEETCTNESEYDSTEEFICSHCGFALVEHKEYAIGEDDGEEYYFNFKPKYCPNCGRKIVG